MRRSPVHVAPPVASQFLGAHGDQFLRLHERQVGDVLEEVPNLQHDGRWSMWIWDRLLPWVVRQPEQCLGFVARNVRAFGKIEDGVERRSTRQPERLTHAES